MSTYPLVDNPLLNDRPLSEHPADSDGGWQIWRIVHSPRWVRSATGPDYLMWQGTAVAIVPDGATGRYRYELGVARSVESWPTEIEAKIAAATVIMAAPRRDKENQKRRKEQT